MISNRRNFIRTTGAFAAGSLILPFACTNNAGAPDAETPETTDTAPAGSLDAFGLQLYTLRDVLPNDVKGVLKQVADFGYPQIEGYEGDMGLWWGMSHTDFKAYLDEIGLNMIASHANINENFEEKAAQAAAIGMKYLICPYIGPQKSMDDWNKVIEKFNQCGEVCNKNGIRFAYHNHEYTFQEMDGVMLQDYLMDNTDPALVDFELDMYWVVTGGADIVSYLKKYPNRFTLCHVKDRIKGIAADEREASCDLGTGSIDYPSILKIAADNGMKYYIVEQERYDNSTSLQSAKTDAEYMRSLVFKG